MKDKIDNSIIFGGSMSSIMKIRLKLLIVSVALLFLLIIIGDVFAGTFYYIALDGNDNNNGSVNSPLKSFSYAMKKLLPGDTLYINDGTYYESLTITVSGTYGNPIIVKALNDGQVTIDGAYERMPCIVTGQEYIDIEGIVCKNSSQGAFKLTSTNNVNVRRVSAYNGSISANDGVFSLWKTNNILLEDVAASGSGRVLYNVLTASNTVIRRCWGRWEGPTTAVGEPEFMQIYNSSDSIVENCIGTVAPGKYIEAGFLIWANHSTVGADRNKFYGNVFFNSPTWGFWVGEEVEMTADDNEFHNNVSINNKYGFDQRGGEGLIVNHQTTVGTTLNGLLINDYRAESDSYSLTLKNSVFLEGGAASVLSNPNNNTLSNTYNDFYNNEGTIYGTITSKGIGEITTQPTYDTNAYGNGAYLIRPSNLATSGAGGTYLGAEVLYRSNSGSLTTIPLWPWPMENRICTETDFSVTYENGCNKGGGLWKTLDGVYTQINTTSPTDTPSSTVDISPSGSFIEAENFTGTINQGTATFITESTKSGFSGTGYLLSKGGGIGSCPSVDEGKSYQVNVSKTGIYKVWMRSFALDNASDSVFIGLDGNCVGAISENGIYNQWVWRNSISSGLNTINIATAGSHTINIWVREPNHLVDGIYVTQGTETPSDSLLSTDTTAPSPPVALMIQ